MKMPADSVNSSMLYFAFGSNMLSARLQRRCPSARVVTRAIAPGYRVGFEKLSEDNSGKAALIACDSSRPAAGVVYALSTVDLDRLDAFEGPGYRRKEDLGVTCLDTGEALRVSTYVARKNVPGLKPYDWYLALVLAGITEHGIEMRFARRLKLMEFDADPRRSRASRRNALSDLEAASIADYLDLLRRGN